MLKECKKQQMTLLHADMQTQHRIAASRAVSPNVAQRTESVFY